jgi:nucleotide-binding universal stress UspA family protein
MEKILIAIDYSYSAQGVAEKGNAIAEAMNYNVVLLHVIEDVGYYSSTVFDPIMGFGGFTNDAFLSADTLLTIENEAVEFLSKTKSHLRNDTIQTKVAHGKIAESIIQIAEKEHCNLIVIGTHGRSSFEELFLGSTAHKLIQNSILPLYIIPIKNK